MRVLLAAAALALLGGCTGPHADPGNPKGGPATDPSLPGIELAGNATWDGGAWHVSADASNRGTQTYRIPAGCDSPFTLEARADGGEPYGEVHCLAYTEPVPFAPGDAAHRGWTVKPGDFHWTGQAHFTVGFHDADRTGEVRAALR